MKPLRILIDGTSLCRKLTGIGRYTYSLIEHLAAHHPDWTLIVVAPYRPVVKFQHANILFEARKSNSKSEYTIGWSFLWFNFFLKKVIDTYHPSFFWAPSGLIPFNVNEKKVVIGLTIHDFVPFRYPETMVWHQMLYRKLNQNYWIKRVDVIYPNSKSTKAEIMDFYHIEANDIIFPGVDEIFSLYKQHTKRGSDDYLLFLGTLEPRKNIKMLLQCVVMLFFLGVWPRRLRLKITGDIGWKNGEIRDLINLLKTHGVVEFLGYVPRKELPNLLFNSRGLLSPSLYEGFGMPISEAIATGCPVICSNINAHFESSKGGEVFFHDLNLKSMLMTYINFLNIIKTDEIKPNLARSNNIYSWNKSAIRLGESILRTCKPKL